MLLHAAGAVHEVIGGDKKVRVRQRSVVAGGVLDGAAVQRQLVGPDFQTVTRPVAHRNRVLEHHTGPAAIAAAVTGLPRPRSGPGHAQFQLRGAGDGHILAEGHRYLDGVAGAVGSVAAGIAGE